MKTPKFLLAENPITNERHDGRSFIIHARKPFILAEIFAFEFETEEEILKVQRQITTGSKLDYPPETFLFSAIFIDENSKELKNKTPQQVADELAGIMRRMADWYKSYLIWEDSQDH